GINANTYPNGVGASFGGDTSFGTSSGTGSLTIAQASSTTTVTCPSSVTYTASPLTPCTASVSGPGGLSQALTVSYSSNTNAGTATASASFAGDANHESSSDTKTLTIAKASSTTTVSCPASVTYSGSPQTPCTASVSGAGGLSQTLTVSYSNNTNAGTATASASFAGDANHDASSGSASFTIAKASSTTTVTCPSSVTFTGSALTPCTASVSGVGGLSQALTVSYSNNSNAGTATASASYAGDANHLGSSDSATFTIDKADAVCAVAGYKVTYDGSPHTATGTCVGVGGTVLSGLDLSGTTHTNAKAGTYTDTWSFTDGGNYNNQSGSVTDEIDEASSSTVVSCPTNVTFTGSALTPCTASVSGVGGLSQALTVSYTQNTNAGTATASASYAGDANHLGSSDSATFTIDKASSSTVVSCPTNVTFTGSALTPCTASVSGVGGLSQTLTVSYSNNTNAGAATASASYAGDAN